MFRSIFDFSTRQSKKETRSNVIVLSEWLKRHPRPDGPGGASALPARDELLAEIDLATFLRVTCQ